MCQTSYDHNIVDSVRKYTNLCCGLYVEGQISVGYFTGEVASTSGLVCSPNCAIGDPAESPSPHLRH